MSEDGQQRRVQPIPRRRQSPPPPGVTSSESGSGDSEVQRSEYERASSTIATSEILFPAPPSKRTLLGGDGEQTQSAVPPPPQITTEPGLATIQPRGDAEHKTNKRRTLRWVAIAMAAVLLGLVVRLIAVQAIYTASPVMDPTLVTGDRFYVNKLSYLFDSAEAGDVVLVERELRSMAAESEGPGFLIRRVIATEGQLVQASDNRILVDGVALDEPYLELGTFTQDFGPITVSEGSVFVLSDSRRELLQQDGSPQLTSTEQIVGKAILVYWPRSSFGFP